MKNQRWHQSLPHFNFTSILRLISLLTLLLWLHPSASRPGPLRHDSASKPAWSDFPRFCIQTRSATTGPPERDVSPGARRSCIYLFSIQAIISYHGCHYPYRSEVQGVGKHRILCWISGESSRVFHCNWGWGLEAAVDRIVVWAKMAVSSYTLAGAVS